MDLPFSKEKQTAHRRKRKHPTFDITESQLQGQLNDLLDAYQIRYMRFPSPVWKWIRENAPVEVKTALSKAFGGMPDCQCLVPLDAQYSLAIGIELKVKGRKKHGKQKHWQSVVCRTPDESIKAVQEFLDAVEIIKKLWERYREEI